MLRYRERIPPHPQLRFPVRLLACLRRPVFLCSVVPTPGSVRVELSHGCWGHVSVCLGTRCGGACQDLWSHNLSSLLCQSLGCGPAIQPTYRGSSPFLGQALITSFHTTAHTRDLSQSAMVVNAQGRCGDPDPAYVVCSGNGGGWPSLDLHETQPLIRSPLLQGASRPRFSLPDTSVLERWRFSLKVGGFQ